MKKPLFALLFLTIAGVPVSRAAILSQWTFDSLTTAASNVASGLTAGDFGTTGTFTGTTGPVAAGTVMGIGGTAPYVFGANGLDTSEGGAISANEFYTVTLTPTAGNMLSFTTLSFNAWANTNFNADSYTFFLRTSLTGTDTLGSGTKTYEIGNGATPNPTTSAFSFDLSGIAELQNVTSETTFMIGVYVTNPPSSGFQGNMRMDSLQIDGTVSPIPEVSSVSLAFAGGAVLLRRRRHQSA